MMFFILGNYIISLSDLCKWLGEQATSLGVDIFTGFAGDKVRPIIKCLKRAISPNPFY
jgi:flavin-dependent dehydrogenase